MLRTSIRSNGAIFIQYEGMTDKMLNNSSYKHMNYQQNVSTYSKTVL